MANTNVSISPSERTFTREVSVLNGSLSSQYVLEIGDFVIMGTVSTYCQKMTAAGQSLNMVGVADAEHKSTDAASDNFRILEAGHGDEFEFALDAVSVYNYGDRFTYSAAKTLTKITSRGSNDNAIAMATRYGSSSKVTCQLLQPAVTEPSATELTFNGNPA